jgi:hypothetical protein
MIMRLKNSWLLIVLIFPVPDHAPAQEPRPPIIDMHVHASDL